jgi:hypothetical protein
LLSLFRFVSGTGRSFKFPPDRKYSRWWQALKKDSPMTIDKKATTQWDKAAISYTNYLKYIDSKADRFELTLIDLLYISNFKGGNSTINEDELKTKDKLKIYSKSIKEIEAEFGSRKLTDLTDKEINGLF